MTVTTRFAPSPTGFLHVGGARTALFNKLYARRHHGKNVLRIENTDLERSTEEATQAILESLAWLGLEGDVGPFFQTQRFDRYREVVEQLLQQGQAYRCYCSKERLEALRDSQLAQKQKPRYDGTCRDMTEVHDAPFVIRFRNPLSGTVQVNDLIRGTVVFQNAELDDLILYRTDGSPTYNFCVVVDDYDMGVTHVIRGEDHLSNTPRQINILQALQAPIPQYAHIPMILGSDGKRLSKRHGAVSVLQYRDMGILPHALLNYLVRLGWSCGDQEIFSWTEMVQLFDLSNVSKSAAVFNPDKLLWLNQHYLKTDPPAEVAEALKPHLEALQLKWTDGPNPEAVVLAQRERVKTLREMAERSVYFYQDTIAVPPELAQKYLHRDLLGPFSQLQTALKGCESWDQATIHAILESVVKEAGIKLGNLAQPLRLVMTGGLMSPSIDVTLVLIGRPRVLARLQAAMEVLQAL